jgi:uridine phosphorylase
LHSFPAGAYISLILQEKLKNTQVWKQEGMVSAEIEAALALSNSSVNILNADSVSRNVHSESESREKSESRTKHHQLKTSCRADAVAAG